MAHRGQRRRCACARAFASAGLRGTASAGRPLFPPGTPGINRIVELRFFAGLSVEKTAEVMGLSPRTVTAKAWLHREISAGKAAYPPPSGRSESRRSSSKLLTLPQDLV